MHVVQDSGLSHPGPSFQRMSFARFFSWLQFGGSGLVVGFPLWGPCLVLVAEHKEGPAQQKKAKKNGKLALVVELAVTMVPPLAISLICPH